jgi:hypothetical protein
MNGNFVEYYPDSKSSTLKLNAAMKRILSLAIVATLLGTAGFAMDPVARGKTNCSLGNYVIEKASDPIMVNGNALETFVVSYENSNISLTVAVDETDKNCTSYLVQSDRLTMQYDCNGKYFGVKTVDKKYRKDGFITDKEQLNRSQYFHQKVITQLEKSKIDHVKLISVYFPQLVNDYEEVFAVK